VNWDQRGCGRTYFRNSKIDPNNQTATFEQALVDLDELVNYVLDRFDKEKVILVGTPTEQRLEAGTLYLIRIRWRRMSV